MKTFQDTIVSVDCVLMVDINNFTEMEDLLQQLQIGCIEYFRFEHKVLNDLSNISTVEELLRDGGVSKTRLEFERDVNDLHIGITLEMTPPDRVHTYEKALIPEAKLYRMFSDLIYGNPSEKE